MTSSASSTARTVGAPIDRIPVSLLTGFLGAGKTTLLNELMKHPAMAGTAVLINEFGEVGIDHHLVEKLDDTTVLLDSGCLCCSVQGDLVAALKQLHLRSSKREIPPVTRVLIETTGLADPVPVIYTLMEERFIAARFVCDSVLTAVDATHGLEQIDRHQEALRQIAMADRLLITKGDLAGADSRAALDARLDTLNPGALRLDVRHGRIEPDQLFGSGIYSTTGKLPDVAAWLGEERVLDESARAAHAAAPLRWNTQPAPARATSARHDDSVSSFVVRFEAPVPWYGFSVAMGRILESWGPRLLRVKGLMNVAGDDLPQVIQCVQDVAYPPLRLPAWPAGGPFDDRHGRLVFITRDIGDDERDLIRTLLANLPPQAAAARAVAANPFMATRCWLSQRMPVAPAGGLQADGWVVQARRFSARPAPGRGGT
ncbi:GTP-binding protein [Methyloversatilis sp.]|uniref:CobW family GTP-binding protein n=1 Tax=Methyloversatilis sp. TaxID=2569862 RepID=UPI002733E4A6|nr:GTP-binding protein [Methyloversatilis sp.]MDP2868394.1 GTP-binding protein [Methyloversatilis sp.]MDP3455710.1 GTP-binding protein [Methyloversatilis sp.]MDP3579656.1 GTP-binding protein [Methyloversatilis sp.]